MIYTSTGKRRNSIKNIHTVNTSYQRAVVIAPKGGFSNHVRWMLLLDNRYDWAKYGNYSLPAFTPDEKVAFILDNVYYKSRKWFNWLADETSMRYAISRDVTVSHELPIATRNTTYSPVIYCTISPKLAKREFMKWSSCVSTHMGYFEQEVQSFNDKYNNLEHTFTSPYSLVIDNTVLYKKTLDVDYYKAVINFMNLDDNYQQANIIHGRWFALHEKAGREVIPDMQKILNQTIDIP